MEKTVKKTAKKQAKAYSRRHIQEAIDYWTRMLREATEPDAASVDQLIKQAEALGLKDLASAAKQAVGVQEGEELNEGAKGAFLAGAATAAIIAGIIANYSETLKKTVKDIKTDAAVTAVVKAAGALEKVNGWLAGAVEKIQAENLDNEKLEELAAAMKKGRPGYGADGLSGAGNRGSKTSKPAGSAKNN